MSDVEREQRAIYLIMAGALTPAGVVAVADSSDVAGGNALGLLIGGLVLCGLVLGVRSARRSRLPAARARRRRGRP